jgi:hypothetical protein
MEEPPAKKARPTTHQTVIHDLLEMSSSPVDCQVTIETITRALGQTNPESRVDVHEQLNAEELNERSR